jgi:hypothetical protein
MTSLHRIEDFLGGWFVGNFSPSLLRNEFVEVCVKTFRKGEQEAAHYQLTATEITVIISGECMVGDSRLGPGDMLVIAPMEVAGFVALSDVTLVAVKTPSIPSDKVLA